jgi:hypothetical protein
MENFFAASKPFLTLARIMGVFPISFGGSTFKSSVKAHHFKFFMLFTIVWLFMQILLFLSTVVIDKEYENSRILSRVWKVVNVMEISSLILNFCFQNLKRRKLLHFLVKIEEVDEIVSILSFWNFL